MKDQNQVDKFSRVLGVLAIVISFAAGTISYLEWRTLSSQLEEARTSNAPNFSVITDVLYEVGDEDGDGDKDSDYHDLRQPVSHELLSTPGTWAKITVNNNGPQDGAIRDVGLQITEDVYYWDAEFDQSIRPEACDANSRSNDVRCQNIWPVGIDNASDYVFYFPLWLISAELIESDTGRLGGLMVALHVIGGPMYTLYFDSELKIAE